VSFVTFTQVGVMLTSLTFPRSW